MVDRSGETPPEVTRSPDGGGLGAGEAIFPKPEPLAGAGVLPPLLHGAVGCSRALHSSWLWVPTLDLMVDAGEGCGHGLGRAIGSPSKLLLTHGHSDHVLGLPGLLSARQFPSLVSGGPLEVVGPAGSRGIEAVRAMVKAMWPQNEFDRIQWTEVGDGDRLPLAPDRELAVFATDHDPWQVSVGYAVRETRRRLRGEFRGQGGAEIAAARASGREVDEVFEKTLFVHTGDSAARRYPLLEGADVAFMDATFLVAGDRDGETHASAEEVLEIADAMAIDTVVLHHLSLRYDRETARARLREMCEGIRPAVYLFDQRTLVRLDVS